MKSIAIMALLGATSAIKLGDAPPYFNEPTWNQKHPSAGGFVQLETKTSCKHAGVTGVDCVPNAELFAVGMNGDEDLGQDITMKGSPYHYDQKLAQFAVGMNGDEDLGQDITMKGNKFHYNQDQKLVQFAVGMNGDEDLGQDIIMKGNKFHYNQQ